MRYDLKQVISNAYGFKEAQFPRKNKIPTKLDGGSSASKYL